MYSSRVFNGLPHIRLLATWFTRTLAKNMTLPPRVACMMASRLARFSLLSDSWAPPHAHKIHFRCTLITCLNTGVAKLKGFTKKKVVQKSFFIKLLLNPWQNLPQVFIFIKQDRFQSITSSDKWTPSNICFWQRWWSLSVQFVFFELVTVAAVESDVHNFIHVPLVARPNLSKTVN